MKYGSKSPLLFKKLSVFLQAGGVPGPKIYDPNRATLEMRNLPAEFNNISKLNDHFSKFGTIINLQVSEWLRSTEKA